MIKFIESESNNKIKFLKNLKQKKYRNLEKAFILEGEKVIKEALEYKAEVLDIYVSESYFKSHSDFLKFFQIDIFVISDKIFNKISETITPQGIMATCKSQIVDIENILPYGRYILLDALNDPGNLGGIIRSADAFSFDGIILGLNTVDPYNEKVVRSTMGSIFRTKLYKIEKKEDLQFLKKKHFRIYASALDASDFVVDTDLTQNVIIIIGNEANGVSDYFIENSDGKIKIPMSGNAESLNANIAASIIMYESERQKK